MQQEKIPIYALERYLQYFSLFSSTSEAIELSAKEVFQPLLYPLDKYMTKAAISMPKTTKPVTFIGLTGALPWTSPV